MEEEKRSVCYNWVDDTYKFKDRITDKDPESRNYAPTLPNSL